MSEKKIYKEYFDIDPKYYAAVTADLIDKGEVKWKDFYPHATFVKLLEKTHSVLAGKDPRSLWVEGAYGTGKSHAVLTVKSLLEASDDDVRAYFEDYGLSLDLCQKLITDKNTGKMVIIHRIGSGFIRSDQDLILAIQDSIMEALHRHGIENHGEESLRDAALKWFEKEANKVYFNSLMQEEEYAWAFGGEDIDAVIQKLSDGIEVQKIMKNILKVAEDNGITALRLDVQGMASWIKSIIAENNISTMLFIWDEFTEFFQNNPNSLTGFQTLAEISLSHPFYFMIVSHESRSLFVNADTAKKILDRFVPPIKIELPENMAFQLMAQAMKKTSDSVLAKEWDGFAEELNGELVGVRQAIEASAKKESVGGKKTVISDDELKAIVPIHPYAALLLKHMSVAFSSNQRSMFDFIISNDMTDAKGFKWFINTYGPLDSLNLLTIDMLWDFFNGKGQNGLNDDVRVILDSFNLLQKDKLTNDEQRVFKTILLLQAISQRISDVELLKPNETNVDLAFSGTDWNKGQGKSIADKLYHEGLIFKKPVGGGKTEYTVANSTGDSVTIEKKKQEVKDNLKTQDLIISADLMSSVQLPASIRGRFEMDSATANLKNVVSKAEQKRKPNRVQMIVIFSIDDIEAGQIREDAIKIANDLPDDMILVECLTSMGNDLYGQYIENMAFSKYYAQNDKTRAVNFERQAVGCLNDWKQKIPSGAFRLYTQEQKSGIRLANLSALQEELQAIEYKRYCYGLSQYHVIDNMFAKGPLAQGAGCGIKEELSGTFKSSNEKNSLSTALAGAWGVENYWEDPAKKSLTIVHIKKKVEELVEAGFASPEGRVSVLSIFEALEDEPFGFIPSNISAFVLGFVLKEYAVSDYFWSNVSYNESMTVDKMKQMIANAINQKVTPNRNYKEEYIVEMSTEQKAFLECTAKVFHIPESQCGSVESARDQVRSKMKQLIFPIWCVKSLLSNESLRSSKEEVSEVVDWYCGIANTANSTKDSESDLANSIGKKINDNRAIVDDLSALFTNEKCKEGMLAYIADYKSGILTELAQEVEDNGAYIDRVKQKFNADAANWVWNSETADEKIDDVILEYQIVIESNKINPNRALSLHDTIVAWNKYSGNIRISFEALKKSVGTLESLLEQLVLMQKSGDLSEQNKRKFYDALLAEGRNFSNFYKDQVQYFKQVAAPLLEDLDETDIEKLFHKIPNGQFTKTSTEYFNFLEQNIKIFLQNQAQRKLLTLWHEKTNTKNPVDWSSTYLTPILCMFSDEERSNMQKMFRPLLDKNAPEEAIKASIEYLQNADFYGRLADAKERDRCFKERLIGDYIVMLSNVDEVREYLSGHISEPPYKWMESTTVRNKLKSLCEKEYLLKGKETAMEVINNMDADQAKKYLCELIADNPTVGMEIIKNQRK